MIRLSLSKRERMKVRDFPINTAFSPVVLRVKWKRGVLTA